MADGSAPNQRGTVFGAMLRSIRLAAGLSQGALAERAGISEKAIGALERGDRVTPRLATVVLLADAMNAHPAERARLLAAAQGDSAPPAPDASSRRTPDGVLSPASHGLFVPPSPLVGRQDEIAAVSRLLVPSSGGARLVTLIGPGGVGKTRVALAVGLELGDAFADGVWFVDLSPVRDLRLVPATIARALDVRESGGRSAHELLIDSLRERQLLLVLDNFEHLLEAAQLVAELLAKCSQLTCLVTSRSALRVRAERRFVVDPLPLPVPAAAGRLLKEAVSSSAATQLFLDRAQAIAPDFVLTNSNAAVIAAICRRLDGLPLAIELAAARTALLDPQTLLERLRQPQEGELIDLPPRQRTVQATISWSYDLLTPVQRKLLACLSAFQAGWTLESAEAACVLSLPADANLGQLVLALVDSSLVRRLPDSGGDVRFGMLETVQEFAWARLVENGDFDAIRRRQLTYFTALAERAEPASYGAQRVAWLDRLEREHDNLRAVLDWSVVSGFATDGLRLAAALRFFWWRRGYFREARGRLERLLSLAEMDANLSVRARALHALAVMVNALGEFAYAQSLLERSVRLFREAGDWLGASRATTSLGGTAFDSGDLTTALPFFEEALTLARLAEDVGETARVLGNLGETLYHLGDLDRAEACHTEALALARQVGRTDVEAFQLGDLANVLRRRGDITSARSLHRAALELKVAAGDRRQIAITLENLAQVNALEGNGERSARLIGAAAALREAIGAPQPVPERIDTEQAVSLARATMGSTEWNAALEAGRMLSLEEAATEALTS